MGYASGNPGSLDNSSYYIYIRAINESKQQEGARPRAAANGIVKGLGFRVY